MPEIPLMIRLILALLLAGPTVYLALVCGYLFVIALAAWLFRKEAADGAARPAAALLIPAHNEEEHIETILADARAMDYPSDQYAVFVLADNCSDATAALARSGGATVLERFDAENPGKGQALDWCLRTHGGTLKSYAFIALVDADMRIHPAFLKELAQNFALPETKIVQGLNTVARPDASWRAAVGYMGFSLINYVRPAGRRQLGGTAELKGSGMAFRTGVLLEYGWPAQSLAEDAEFSKRLFLDGVLVRFNPDAKVTSEIPWRAAQARVQQARWDAGKGYILRAYLPPLLRHALRRPSLSAVDAVIDLLVPPISLLVFLLLATGAVSVLVHPAWTAGVALCGAAAAFAIVTALLRTGAPLRVWLYLAALPLFLGWKVLHYLRLLAHKGARQWTRTPRDRELERGE